MNSPGSPWGRQWLKTVNPSIEWRTGVMSITRRDGSKWVIRANGFRDEAKPIIKKISLKRMRKLIRKPGYELFGVRLRSNDVDRDVHEELEGIVEEYDDIFRDELPDATTPKRDVDFEINLKTDEPPPVRPVIRL